MHPLCVKKKPTLCRRQVKGWYEAAALAGELGLSLAEHDDPAHAGASTYVGVTQTRERAKWRAVKRGGRVRLGLGSYRSATAAAVAVAQWERDHPSDGPARGVLGGFASPSESLSWEKRLAPSDCARTPRAERRFAAADRRR